VRLDGCGICSSHLSIWEGRPWFAYPREAGAPGHEGWGVIEAVGPSVRGLEIGDRVAMLSRHAYAEFDVAPSDRVIALPEELDDEPFPAESFGLALSIFERSCIRAGHVVAILGDGFIELLLVQLCADAGAHVVLFSEREDTWPLAEAMDVEATIGVANDRKGINRALQLTAGRGFDCVIELTGKQRSLQVADAIAADRATLVLDRESYEWPRNLYTEAWQQREIRVVNAHGRSLSRRVDDVRKAIEAALLGKLDPFPLLTHKVPLRSLDHGFRLLRDRPAGFVKALMVNDIAA
jgi:NADPH2:quinone reductase